MGLLDDAIREHLDLKRRRGGDPVEIERAEQEALGPVRRGPEEAEQEPTAPPAEEGHQYDYEAEPEWDESYVEEHESAAPPAGSEHAEHAEHPVPADHPGDDEPFAESEEAPADRASAAEAPARPVDEHTGQETAEYDVEGHLKRHHDEDVLEETPEFLQDTPEHDRLWFEQRPPRDFDFDG